MATKTAEKTESTFSGKYTYACGKRKTSIARTKLYAGKGKIVVNGKDAKDYFATADQVASMTAPLKLVGKEKEFDIEVRVIGGGLSAQADACRHGVSKALTEIEKELRPELKQAGFLRRDARVKERKKPGLHGARRSPQWAKR